jgi:predicted 2-oxoglutarate/Fe(II)-dependent dioxygenase YbiX
MAAALPSKPPLFNRCQAGPVFGNHIDNAIRQVTGMPYRIRTVGQQMNRRMAGASSTTPDHSRDTTK